MDRDTLISQIQKEQNLERASTLVELLKALDEEAKNRRIFWSNPLMLAISGGLISIVGSIVLGAIQHYSELELEKQKAVNDLVLNAIGNDPDASRANFNFLAQAGLLGDLGEDISSAADAHPPVVHQSAPQSLTPQTPTALFFGSFSNYEAAESYRASLSEIDVLKASELKIMFREEGSFYSVFLEVENLHLGRYLIRNLPDSINRPFIRTIQETCETLGVEQNSEHTERPGLLCRTFKPI